MRHFKILKWITYFGWLEARVLFWLLKKTLKAVYSLGYIVHTIVVWNSKLIWQIISRPFKLISQIINVVARGLEIMVNEAQRQKILAKRSFNKYRKHSQLAWYKQKQFLNSWHFKLEVKLGRAALSFVIMLIVVLAPAGLYYNYRGLVVFKNKLFTAASAAMNDLKSAKDDATNKNFSEASNNFNQASHSFWNMQKQIGEINSWLFELAAMIPNEKLKLAGSAPIIAEAGRQSALMGAALTAAMDDLLATGPLTYRLDNFITKGYEALEAAGEVNAQIGKLDSSAIPLEYRDTFLLLKENGVWVKNGLAELLDIADKLSLFLGNTTNRRYLLVFQNTTEARATGGFIGSFAVVDFSKGEIKQIQTPGGGTYDVEYGMKRFIAAPEPLRLVRGRWMMWDCNWWPDWPTSARKIMWFYEQSDGSTVDGIISITPQVVIDLLRIVGPVSLPAYNEVITADNFLDVVQKYAEQKEAVTNKPKAIIGDLNQALIEKLGRVTNQELLMKMLSALIDNFDSKNILLYFNDVELQDKVVEQGWDGGVRATTGDYLQVVNTNIAGGKSDRTILESINHKAELRTDGSVVDTVTIKREHTAIRGALFTGVRNVNWMRIYVPLGSELLSASGWKIPDAKLFDLVSNSWEVDEQLINEISAEVEPVSGTKIYREQDKTVFAGWSMVDPGEVTEITLSYRLPFNIKALNQTVTNGEKQRQWLRGETGEQLYKYTLLAQKQAGSINSRLRSELILPENKTIAWQYPTVSNLPYRQLLKDQYWTYLIKED